MGMALVKPQPTSQTFSYERRRPEESVLYKIIQQNLLSFYEQLDLEYENGLPDFVKKEFEGSAPVVEPGA